MDKNSEARLLDVNPNLAELIRHLADMLAIENITIRVTQGLRSWSQQAALFGKGRTTPGIPCNHNVVEDVLRAIGSCPEHPWGLVVTHAQPGYSWHNFGLACDVAPFAGGIPDWNVEHPAWKRIVAVGESLGLVSGIAWTDEPHFQLTGRFRVTPDDEVRQIFTDGGMAAVWQEAFKLER